MYTFTVPVLFFLSILFGILVAMGIWFSAERPCDCYKTIALGTVGGVAGTAQGMTLVPMLGIDMVNQVAPTGIVFFLSALFAAILQYRYAAKE